MHEYRRSSILPWMIGCALSGFLFSSHLTAQQSSVLTASAMRSAIEARLGSTIPRLEQLFSPAQSGVRVNNIDVERTTAGVQRVTIDVSQRALSFEPSGDVERLLDQMLAAVAPLTNDAGHVDFDFLIDGVPLEQFVERPRVASQTRATGGAGPIVISAGHGWYFDESLGRWTLQRDYYGGIVEDLVNWDIARNVLDELSGLGVDARPARDANSSDGLGPSGYPRWQESAKYFIRAQGAPSDVSDFGANEYNRDINSRPFYANWIDASTLISIHNNGGGGTGTETWFDESNGLTADSERLAHLVNDHVVAAIRQRYDSQWPDRGLRSCNGCKGETRLASRPAVILEVAFMDMPAPDNAALHDATFKRIVAQAVRDALREWMRTN